MMIVTVFWRFGVMLEVNMKDTEGVIPMKKFPQSKAALAMALGMSLLASAAASLPAFAENATNGLFQLSEATQPLVAEKDAKTGCGKGSCSAKTKKAEHKCAHKGHKCGSKHHAHKCGAKEHKCAAKAPDKK
jgi:uncharacterized low-complexity protein